MSDLPDSDKISYQAEILGNRLIKRYKHLRKWAKRIGATAWRLYDRDIPEIPLVLDIYGDYIVGALYERPYAKAEDEEEQWLNFMTTIISHSLNKDSSLISMRRRLRQRGQNQYSRLASSGNEIIVKEGGLQFTVNIFDYLDTGLFLDHRKTRDLIRQAAHGRHILNLFCYTAAFSIYAASGGALSTVSVDLSNTYLEKAEKNFLLNAYSATHVKPEAISRFASLARSGQGLTKNTNALVRADVLRFVHEAGLAGHTWDLIILDPPTFSNSKKMTQTLDIRRDYHKLLDMSLKLLSPSGELWFSTNARSFALDRAFWPAFKIEDLKEATRDEDFRGRSLRACYRFSRPRSS